MRCLCHDVFHVLSNVCVQEGKQSVGVRLALGETQVVAETRSFLIDNGVALDSFSQVRSHKLPEDDECIITLATREWRESYTFGSVCLSACLPVCLSVCLPRCISKKTIAPIDLICLHKKYYIPVSVFL